MLKYIFFYTTKVSLGDLDINDSLFTHCSLCKPTDDINKMLAGMVPSFNKKWPHTLENWGQDAAASHL